MSEEFVIPNPPKATPAEASYPASELIAAAKPAFGVEPYVVRAMLKHLGKDTMTKSEAQAALTDFLSRPA